MARTSSESTSSSLSSLSLVALTHVLVILFSISLISSVDASGDQQLGWISTRSSSTTSTSCKGSIAECALAGDEFELDSEINRRILATTQYISYGALNKNTVPCTRRGNSYYNCQTSGQANPYNRGCSTITRCRN